MESIGAILTRHGSDKDTIHAYGPVYDSLFPDRAVVRLVLELGVGHGHSLRAWCEAFPAAHVVGVDLHLHPGLASERIECHRGDQKNPQSLLEAVRGRSFDLIVDDASHRTVDQLLSLFHLWPHLASGGFYVIEELAANSTGHGNPALSANCALFAGATVYPTCGQLGPEPLVVIRK